MTDAEISPITRTADLERTPAGVVKRWLAELEVAHKAEKDWRDDGKKLWELYEGGKRKNHAFNILWSNTDTMAPALYNSTPQPDVRRRFRDADPLGKAVSQVMERSLSYEIDSYDFDASISAVVLDLLVVGRAVPRVRYEPRFVGAPDAATEAAGGPGDEQAPQAAPTAERVAERSVRCEGVQWDDFRRSSGKTWGEVTWVAFRHDFTQEMAADKFGEEIAAQLKYSEGKDSESLKDDKPTREVFKTVEVWEIWDKDQRRVLFIAPNFKTSPLMVAEDPLRLTGFFPIPRPAYAVPNPTTLVPTPLFKLYEEQAKELDRVSERINKIVAAMKVRGAYSANLPEVAHLLEAGEGEMIPVQNVSEIASIGGLDKAIWTLQIEKLQQVLTSLYQARDQIKATIYEITGISDILRGATDASETATAQRIKADWGSIRLQKMQREVQRLVRDLFRLKAEIIAEQYPLETLQQVTNLQYPTMQQKQQAMAAVQQAQAMGQPPPPEVQQILGEPAWEEIAAVMKSDKLREYRVDIETDSTVSETLDRDMQGLTEVVTAVGGVIASVAEGTPPEVAKEVALAIARRARLGNAVEDALENFQVPQAQGQLEQVEGVKQQIMDIIKQAGAKQVQADMAAQEQQAQTQQIGQAVQQVGPAVEQLGQTAVMGMQELAARQDQQAQMLAEIGQGLQGLQATAGQQTAQAFSAVAESVADVVGALQQVMQGLQVVMETVQKPKAVKIARDEQGRIIGASSETVQ